MNATTTRINVYYRGPFCKTGIDNLPVSVVSTTDYANSDGTGVACLNIPEQEIEHVRDWLDQADNIESYHQR